VSVTGKDIESLQEVMKEGHTPKEAFKELSQIIQKRMG